MIVDSSALVAILTTEADCEQYLKALTSDVPKWMSSPSLLETCIVLQRAKGPEGVRILRLFLADANVQIVPFTEADAETAFEAYVRFGKGTGHPAQLNILDTCAYALATRLKQPILFKGMDFLKTDVVTVL